MDEEKVKPPMSISHKELNSFLKTASDADKDITATPVHPLSEYQNTIKQLIELTNRLDLIIEHHQSAILESVNNKQSMALGALHVHLKLAVNASNAFLDNSNC